MPRPVEIEIIIKDDNGVMLAKRTARGFESAEENLGKLEREYDKKDQDLAAISEEEN